MEDFVFKRTFRSDILRDSSMKIMTFFVSLSESQISIHM